MFISEATWIKVKATEVISWIKEPSCILLL
jgi:hypothetical protein